MAVVVTYIKRALQTLLIMLVAALLMLPVPAFASVADEGRDIQISEAEIQEALRQGTEGMPAIDEPYADIFLSASPDFYDGLTADSMQSFSLMSVADPEYRLASIAGEDRYQTAAEVVQEAFPDCQTSDSQWTIIANGDSWADALAATALAGALNCPILLSRTDMVPTATVGELERLGVNKVIIVGGTGVISATVESSLCADGRRQVIRLAGEDRYGTAEAIFKYGQSAGVSGSSVWADTAIIASGMSFADALAISPVAFAEQIPIFLVPVSCNLAESSLGIIRQCYDLRSFVAVGGIGRITDDTVTVLRAIADSHGNSGSLSVQRLAGEDRYGTSAVIADWAADSHGFSWNDAGIASGTAAPDALAGSVLQGQLRAVLLLVSPTSTATTAALSDAVQSGAGIEKAHIFGGHGAVSNRTRKAIAIVLDYTILDIEDYRIYVYLDAGHGPNDMGNNLIAPGAVSGAYTEYQLNTELVEKIGSRLADKWPITFRPNVDGGPYYLRDDEAVALGCDFIVSIHFNAIVGAVSGTESYISESTSHPDSWKLQERMHGAVVDILRLPNLGMKQEDFAIISNQKIPAVLLEVCFIDNAADMQVYQSRKEQVADSLAAAILGIETGSNGLDTWQ